MRRILLMIGIILAVIGMVSCGEIKPEYDSYTTQNFSAELNGTLREVDFQALIEQKDGVWRVEYIGNGVLAGLCVEAYPDKTAILQRCGVTVPCEADAVSGLLSPLTALLDTETPQTVRKEGQKTHLTLSDDRLLILNEQLFPSSYRSEQISFDVVWWERTAQTENPTLSSAVGGGGNTFVLFENAAEIQRIFKSDAA